MNHLVSMNNMGIVVESLDKAIAFFEEIGLKLEGRMHVAGEWAGRVTGLGDQNVEIAMMVTPDGHSRLELSRFIEPKVIADHRRAPINALGYLRVMFQVKEIDELVAALSKNTTPNWSARSCNMKISTGSAISAVQKGFWWV
jgi:hypothetical protein